MKPANLLLLTSLLLTPLCFGEEGKPAESAFKSEEARKAEADYVAAVRLARVRYGEALAKAKDVLDQKQATTSDSIVKEALKKESEGITAELVRLNEVVKGKTDAWEPAELKTDTAKKASSEYQVAVKAAKARYLQNLLNAQRAVQAKGAANTEAAVREALQQEATLIGEELKQLREEAQRGKAPPGPATDGLRTVKANEDAINKNLRLGDLEAANALEEKKLALQRAQKGSTGQPSADQAGPAVKWSLLPETGIPPSALVLDYVDKADADAGYLAYIWSSNFARPLRGHEVARYAPNAKDGAFPGKAIHNDSTYYLFYLYNITAQNVALQLTTTPNASIKAFLDADVVADASVGHATNIRAPLSLRAGRHVLVIKHTNTWADRWIGVKLLGNKLVVGG